ncbi:MAG: transcription termination/antitermination protein NusG [Methyloceanibacter sp.]
MRYEYGHYSARPTGWAVINTQPHRERIALENLQRQEFTPYCPIVKRRLRHARRVVDVLRPLFPGYLFVKINPEVERWRPMLSTFGVRNVVRCHDKVSLLDDAFVQALRAREVEGVISRPQSPYQIGQEVRISGGAFDGLVATIVEMHAQDRLTVLMQILSRAVNVRIDEDQISPV